MAKSDGGATMQFCSQCGAKLATGGRFCSACGQAIGAAVAGATASSTPTSALVVLGLFLAVGLGLWIGVLQPGQQIASAPPRGGPPPGAPGAPAGQMPPDHPPMALPDEAKRFIEQLTAKAEAAPTDAGAWTNLAQVQARAAELDPAYGDKAIESYRHVLGLNPDDADALRGLANVYYDQEKYDDAAAQYERYLKTHPDDPNIRTDLATTYLYQRQVDKAVEAYKAVLKDNPKFLQARFNLGLAYETRGQRDEALKELAEARALAPDEPTRTRIDRVVAQLKGEAGAPSMGGADGAAGGSGIALAETPPGGRGGMPAAPGGAPATGGMPAGHPDVRGGAGAGTPAAAKGPSASDYQGEIESSLRKHQILGPKISAIEWPDATRTRVVVTNFPMQSMPEFARNLFKGRLETIIYDAKTWHGVTESRTIEIVDGANGTVMETVTL
jgi:tetratricopeptide (TPR) repeat protein